MTTLSLSEKTHEIFRKGGVLEAVFQFPHREGQYQMAMAVATALEEDKVALTEAGTGTGKTLAYGIPLALHAMEEKNQFKQLVKGDPETKEEDWVPFAISVHTVALQEQLVTDSELIKMVLQQAGHNTPDIRRISGRTNYLCENTAGKLYQNPKTSEDTKAKILEILTEHREKKRSNPDRYEGLFSQLPSTKNLPWDLRQAISAHENNCKCKDCNRATAWGKAKKAEVVVINHSLSQFFPYQKIVVDEAHTFQPVIADQMEFTVDLQSFKQKLEKLKPLPGIQPHFDNWTRAIETVQTCFLTELKNVGTHIQGRLGNFFKIPPAIILADPEGKDRSERSDNLGEALRSVVEHRKLVLDQACDLHGLGKNSGEYNFIPGTAAEKFAENIELLSKMSDQLGKCLDGETDFDARWVDIISNPNEEVNYVIRKAMVDMSQILGKIHEHGTACLTSATMSGVNGLESFQKAHGIPDSKAIAMRCPSPFNLEHQMEFRVPENMPAPGKEEKAYQMALPAAVREAILATAELPSQKAGGTLVLFTAKNSMDATFDQLEKEFPLLRKQDQTTSKQELVNWMKETPGATLFGLESFWTGIDLPGDDLKHVVITRLPFKPGSWKEEKQRELANRRGENGFLTVDVNQALLPLHQGVGRLIRKTTDTGLLTILDTRIMTMSYGSYFREGLPEAQGYEVPGLAPQMGQAPRKAREVADIGL